jgi:Metallo-beta-lactamase superfamily
MTEQEEITMSHNAHETTRADDDGCRCHMIDAPAIDTAPFSPPGVSRGGFLRRSAVGLALPAGLALIGQPVVRALAGSDVEAATYDPVPATAKGPAIPSKGYLVQQIGAGLYYLTDGIYQMMFLTSGQGVIAVDAPPTIGHNILRAIAEVTSEPVTHVIYSHVHADHIGAAVLYPHDAVRIAHSLHSEVVLLDVASRRPVCQTVPGPCVCNRTLALDAVPDWRYAW